MIYTEAITVWTPESEMPFDLWREQSITAHCSSLETHYSKCGLLQKQGGWNPDLITGKQPSRRGQCHIQIPGSLSWEDHSFTVSFQGDDVVGMKESRLELSNFPIGKAAHKWHYFHSHYCTHSGRGHVITYMGDLNIQRMKGWGQMMLKVPSAPILDDIS